MNRRIDRRFTLEHHHMPPRRLSNPSLRRWWWLVVLLIAGLVRLGLIGDRPPGSETLAPDVFESETHQVQRVVDGDTLLLANKARVRLIGIDTPETVKPDTPPEPWGAEASAFTKQFVRGGTVRLEFDRERVDQYDRVLAYVYVDDQMLNEELLRAGLARMEPQYRYAPSMKRRFRAAEDEARAQHLGIWSDRN
ncbi:MAG: thermonuclease family protein [Pirellulales bacterium]